MSMRIYKCRCEFINVGAVLSMSVRFINPARRYILINVSADL